MASSNLPYQIVLFKHYTNHRVRRVHLHQIFKGYTTTMYILSQIIWKSKVSDIYFTIAILSQTTLSLVLYLLTLEYCNTKQQCFTFAELSTPNKPIYSIWKERFCQRLHQRSLFTFTVWVQGAGLPRRAYQATVFSSWGLFESVYVFRKIKLWPHFKASLSLSLSLSTHIYIFTLQKPLIEKGQMQTPQVLMVSKYTRFHHTRILTLVILHSKNGTKNTTKKSFLLFLDDLSPTNLFRSTKRNSIWSSCTLIENTVISLHIVYV